MGYECIKETFLKKNVGLEKEWENGKFKSGCLP